MSQHTGVGQLGPGQVAVITGGAAGIGLALGRALAGRGVQIVLADVDGPALAAAVKDLQFAGHAAMGVVTDVANPTQVEALRDAALDRFGKVDLLFNNAGIYPGMQPVWMIDPEGWRRLFEINYWGIVNGLRAFVPHFIAQGRGHVVTTASMSGLSTVPGSADYGSAKHAAVALSETLRADLDLGGHGQIGVTILCPSVVMTDMGRRALGVFDASGDAAARAGVGSGPDLSAVLEPAALAEAAIAGIEAGQLYVTPTPRSRDRFLGRIRPILDAFERQPVSHGTAVVVRVANPLSKEEDI